MKLSLTIIFLLFFKISFAQVYQTSKNRRDDNCYIKINQDSSIIFIIEKNEHTLYVESVGNIKHISDSTYLITTRVVFAQSIFKNDHNEFSRFDVQVDSIFPYFKEVENLTVKYYDGKSSIIKTQKGTFTNFYFDKRRFNKQHSFVKVYTERRNPITKKLIYTDLFIKASVGFSSEGSSNFQVVINKNTLKTIGEPPLDSGSFVLKKVL